MLNRQLRTEFKRSINSKNLLKWLIIILIIPLSSFYPIRTGYLYYSSVEVFQEMVGLIIPMIFPVLVVFIYLPNFVLEQKNNFITYTRSRIPINQYILSKGLMNAFLTGTIIFLMVFFSFVFAVYIEPNILHVISLTPADGGNYNYNVTFSQLLVYGDFVYGIVYSLWVGLNASLYSTISFLLLLIISRTFIGLSLPFLFYHIFNFITAIIVGARFSPISTIFPFNIEQQEIWTAMIPFAFLLIVAIILLILVVLNKEDWKI
ncbi:MULTISPECIES: ABC transporter permease [Bacillaceae]|jgi:hypothetical protein|uniref:ABC transporter permease n=1 Tax=Bacillaceae TaxID=186817 RepID=UPI0004E27DC7|nr:MULTISPECIES: ABC transporter permease [Bacillaceae]MCM3364911.1 ABC transporter permease [Niallia sp. MER TA 168]